jgi:hypothetical protein
VRKLARLLFVAASALSLGLCVATVVFWARSYSGFDQVRADVGRTSFAVRSGWGRASLSFESHAWADYLFRAERTGPVPSTAPGAWAKALVAFDFRSDATAEETRSAIVLPWWCLTAVTAILPAVAARGVSRRRRAGTAWS